MKHQSKLSKEQHQQAAGEALENRQQGAQEFGNAEALLRFDAAQTAVPPEIGERLKGSAGGLPAPRRSWWKNLFGQ